MRGLEVGLVVGDMGQVGELEELPIDSLWVGGHVASPNPAPEAMVQLARLSSVAHRVTIGTAILLLPLYPPAVVAKQIADLDRATGGRVILGVGVGGEYPAEFRACEVPLSERGPRTDEAIGLLRRLWSAEEIATHESARFCRRLDEACGSHFAAHPTGRPADHRGGAPTGSHATGGDARRRVDAHLCSSRRCTPSPSPPSAGRRRRLTAGGTWRSSFQGWKFVFVRRAR